jgi:hypothetical protein
VADYGIVDDFKNVIPILKEKTKGMKWIRIANRSQFITNP